jgi:hypothetical protein
LSGYVAFPIPEKGPDARREHEAVEAAQGSRQRADLARSAEYEQLHSFASPRIVAAEQGTHVA